MPDDDEQYQREVDEAWNISSPEERGARLAQLKLQRRNVTVDIIKDAAKKDQAQAYALDKLTAQAAKLADTVESLDRAVQAKVAAINERAKVEREAREREEKQRSRIWTAIQPILRSPAMAILLMVIVLAIAKCAGITVEIPGIGETHESSEAGIND